MSKEKLYFAVKCRWNEPEDRMLTYFYNDSLQVMYEWIISWCTGGEIVVNKKDIPSEGIGHLWITSDVDETKEEEDMPEEVVDDVVDRYVNGKKEWTISVHVAHPTVFEQRSSQ